MNQRSIFFLFLILCFGPFVFAQGPDDNGPESETYLNEQPSETIEPAAGVEESVYPQPSSVHRPPSQRSDERPASSSSPETEDIILDYRSLMRKIDDMRLNEEETLRRFDDLLKRYEESLRQLQETKDQFEKELNDFKSWHDQAVKDMKSTEADQFKPVQIKNEVRGAPSDRYYSK